MAGSPGYLASEVVRRVHRSTFPTDNRQQVNSASRLSKSFENSSDIGRGTGGLIGQEARVNRDSQQILLVRPRSIRVIPGDYSTRACAIMDFTVSGPIAQWKSGRLISGWSEVRSLLGPSPLGPYLAAPRQRARPSQIFQIGCRMKPLKSANTMTMIFVGSRMMRRAR